MASPIIDSVAANKLNISITTITPAQAWRHQIRGVYALIYLHAQADFVHLKDFDQWVKNYYEKHTHTNGNKGNPTGKPIQRSFFSTSKARSFLQSLAPVGYIRKGVMYAQTLITDFYRQSQQDV